MKAASEFSAGSRPPQVSSLSQSERWTDGDDRPGKPEREERSPRTALPPPPRLPALHAIPLRPSCGTSRATPHRAQPLLTRRPGCTRQQCGCRPWRENPALAGLSKWARLDSNQGPTDYESRLIRSVALVLAGLSTLNSRF